jgi:hypothetical protein
MLRWKRLGIGDVEGGGADASVAEGVEREVVSTAPGRAV